MNCENQSCTLGFVGTGTISEAVVRAFCAIPDMDANILLSPRNRQTAEKLAAEFAQVQVAHSNQAVLDGSNVVFIALRRQIVQEELRTLQFGPRQHVVSFVPGIARQSLAEWCRVDIGRIFRAVPLPFIAQHQSSTPIFPANARLEQWFGKTGGAMVAHDEAQFDGFMLGGSMMGVYFRFARSCAEWLARQVGEPAARQYVGELFTNLAHQGCGLQAPPDFAALEREYSTPGGTNEMVASGFERLGGVQALRQALDAALAAKPAKT